MLILFNFLFLFYNWQLYKFISLIRYIVLKGIQLSICLISNKVRYLLCLNFTGIFQSLIIIVSLIYLLLIGNILSLNIWCFLLSNRIYLRFINLLWIQIASICNSDITLKSFEVVVLSERLEHFLFVVRLLVGLRVDNAFPFIVKSNRFVHLAYFFLPLIEYAFLYSFLIWNTWIV